MRESTLAHRLCGGVVARALHQSPESSHSCRLRGVTQLGPRLNARDCEPKCCVDSLLNVPIKSMRTCDDMDPNDFRPS